MPTTELSCWWVVVAAVVEEAGAWVRLDAIGFAVNELETLDGATLAGVFIGEL